MSGPNKWRRFVTRYGGPVLGSHGFVRVESTTAYRRDWDEARSAWVKFISQRRNGYGDSEVAFQVLYGFVIPTVHQRLTLPMQVADMDFNFYETLQHDRRHFLDVAGNIWEFRGDDKLEEFTEKLDDLGRRLVAIGDDPTLLLAPNDIDPFHPKSFWESRQLFREQLGGGAAAWTEPGAT